ncbi:hypothetical protein B6U99_02425 [Candidatus Geothermarchaeota archaeon ex4572_27]|nr:MAG: hypothetical protein B6U99_02425 [Candidatus Geothermarchaeota archaeon ex4572_27]
MKEVRRLQVTGGSTYIISLPKEWVLRHGLKKGDHVVLLSCGDKLVIAPRDVEAERSVDYRVSRKRDDAEEVVRQVISYYLAGYDAIRVIFDEPWEDLRVRIKKVIRKKMLGFEVSSEDQGHVEIRSLMRHGEFPLTSTVRRLFELVGLILNDIMAALEGLDRKVADDIIAQDDDVDRLYLYMMRTIRYRISQAPLGSEEVIEPYEYVIYTMVVKALERIADHVVRIAHILKALRNAPQPEILDGIVSMLRESADLFVRAKEAFLRRDSKAANEIINSAKKLLARETELTKMIERARQELHTAILCRIMIESARRIGEYAADIGEMTVDLATTPPGSR